MYIMMPIADKKENITILDKFVVKAILKLTSYQSMKSSIGRIYPEPAVFHKALVKRKDYIKQLVDKGELDEKWICVIKNKHNYELEGDVYVEVPSDQYDLIAPEGGVYETEDETDLIYERGPSLPEGQKEFVCRETASYRCTRCGDWNTETTP